MTKIKQGQNNGQNVELKGISASVIFNFYYEQAQAGWQGTESSSPPDSKNALPWAPTTGIE